MTTFTDTFDRLRHTCDRSHESRMQLLREIRSDVSRQAARTRKQLAELAADLHRGGAIFRK